jgi:hypothetical protein
VAVAVAVGDGLEVAVAVAVGVGDGLDVVGLAEAVGEGVAEVGAGVGVGLEQAPRTRLTAIVAINRTTRILFICVFLLLLLTFFAWSSERSSINLIWTQIKAMAFVMW